MRIIEHKRIYFIISAVVIAAGLAAMAINAIAGRGAFNYDVDFSAGTSMTIDIGQAYNVQDVSDIITEVTGQSSPQVQAITGGYQVAIKMLSVDQETRIALIDAISDKYGLDSDAVLDVSDVSPTISADMQRSALYAVLAACAAMLVYVSLRFKDLRMGASAILALLHDALVMLAAYAILRIPLNYAFIAAILTVLGYSINATIVIFDRVRENRGLDARTSNTELVNTSVRQTMTRSLFTSLTTLFTVAALCVFGVQSVREFTLPILVGIVCGTYSSVFLAGSIWHMLSNAGKKRERV